MAAARAAANELRICKQSENSAYSHESMPIRHIELTDSILNFHQLYGFKFKKLKTIWLPRYRTNGYIKRFIIVKVQSDYLKLVTI